MTTAEGELARAASEFGYNPALDGLRAISVVGVILGHAGLPLLAGYHGVTVFFVISGYLITSLLVQEEEQRGSIAFGRFYRRRFARLGPALVLIVAVTLAWLIATGVSARTYWAGVVGALTYTTDLIQGIWGNGQVSEYFQYTWSLGIEEQFYLIWPLALLGLLRLRSVNVALVMLASGVAVTWVARAVQDALHPSHELQYYGPISHADGLMWGAIIALVMMKFGTNARLRKVAAIAGPIGLLGLAFVFAKGNGLWGVERIDQAGFGQTAVCATAVVLWVATSPKSWFGRAMSSAPFALVGKLSYGLYLWNLLTVVAFVAVVHADPVRTPLGLIWAAVLFGITYASWRFFETPLRRRWANPRPRAVLSSGLTASTADGAPGA